MNKCVICGADLPLDMTQLCFATKNKGVASVCMSHEFSKELKCYIERNGGIIPIIEALKNKPQ